MSRESEIIKELSFLIKDINVDYFDKDHKWLLEVGLPNAIVNEDDEIMIDKIQNCIALLDELSGNFFSGVCHERRNR